LGIDYTLPTGSPIYAPIGGIAKHFTGSQAGTAIYLQGDDGKIHRLMHMSKRALPDNARVKEGDVVGYVGSTGLSTGAHLHWDVYNGKGIKIENFVDPEQYLKDNTKPMTTKEQLLDNYAKQGEIRKEQIALVDKLKSLNDQQSSLRAQEKDLINQLK
jgi:hypothetical protein